MNNPSPTEVQKRLSPRTWKWGLVWVGLLIALLRPLAVEAHFIWIETDPKGAPGKDQNIQVYFGEPHEFLREEAGGRLDRHDELQAWTVGPKSEPTEIALKKELNRFSGVVTPQRVGRYNVIAKSLNHEVMDLTKYDRGIVKPLFFARTQFLSFESGRVSEREEEPKEYLDLDILPVTRALDPQKGSIVPKVGSEVAVRVIFQGEALVKRRVYAFGPNGWIKEMQATDSWGVTTFVPLWPGRYVLQVMHNERAPGEFEGKPYEILNYRATLSILVNE